MVKACGSQDMLVLSAASSAICFLACVLSECAESKQVHQRSSDVLRLLSELVKTERACGVSGSRRSSAICGVGVGCGACLESAAGRNRMSQCVSVEPAPQISGSRRSFPGQQGSTGAAAPRLAPSGHPLCRENTAASDREK